MRLNVWAMAFVLVATALAVAGWIEDDLTLTGAALVAAIFAHAES